jgi:hypothetical protein
MVAAGVPERRLSSQSIHSQKGQTVVYDEKELPAARHTAFGDTQLSDLTFNEL